MGDAFGEQWFYMPADERVARKFKPYVWPWTDDTHVALSVVETLAESRGIDPDALALRFARRFAEDPGRGYAGGAYRLLKAIVAGADWRVASPELFDGGSYGNGAAMRAAPIGAYFAGDAVRSAAEANHSAVVTHAHLEGRAGAIAVAVAAALVAQDDGPTQGGLLRAVAAHVPAGETRSRIEQALEFAPSDRDHCARTLGSGYEVSAQDTVPYCLWVVAHHGEDFETALWQCIEVGGDMDTTCAIVGGILGAAGRPIPDAWLARRERLPAI